MALDIQALARKAAGVAFDLASSVGQTVTIDNGGPTTYNATTDVTTNTGAGTYQVTGVLLYEEESEDPDKEDKAGRNEAQAIVEIARIPAGRTIDRDGTLTDASSRKWHVKDVTQDPAGATMTLTLKR